MGVVAVIVELRKGLDTGATQNRHGMIALLGVTGVHDSRDFMVG
jgi:hypothetical protein